MRQLFTIILLIASLSVAVNLEAQEATIAEEEIEKDSESGLSFGADLVSRYVWRGMDYGNSAAVQPYIEYEIKGFKVGAWGTYAFSNNSLQIDDSTTLNLGKYSEFDFYLSYTYKWFTLMLYDYYVTGGLGPGTEYNYFDYDKGSTGHAVEASLIFEGPEKFPIWCSVNTVIYGEDKNQDESGIYGAGEKNNYSTYLELGYTFGIADDFIELSPFIGASVKGSAWYGEDPGIINLGFSAKKEIQLTKKYAVPLMLSTTANPMEKKIFLVFSLGL